ncbi:MAG: hypothetical protein K6T63_02605 [Alicyclobacillus herbarius]|uniref:hypothetical protein n=1 Tax=Alicyclobacillus herbarius TaxID=122960 RepID=UPI0012DC9647|nr:hypothetical protein [Alicyclobacillus herbarius]MCL6631499.1 hypothetical protein [Alicyclobacillus herbarius]
MMGSVGWLVIVAVLWTCLVFAVARRIGTAEGRQEAKAEIPIQLRVCALREGRCPVCDKTYDTIAQEE